MLKVYQTVMRSVELTDEAKMRIRGTLSHARAGRKTRWSSRGPVKTALAAAAVVVVLGCTALAAAPGFITFFSGGVNDGGLVAEELDVLICAQEGRILLTTPDGEIDITDLCSEREPYIHPFVDGEGAQHYIIAGGTAERCGFVEYVIDPVTGGAEGQGFLGECEEPETPAWLIAGEVALGIRPAE